MPLRKRNRLPFDAVPVSRADGITVPAGYRASVFVPWRKKGCQLWLA